MFPLMQSIVDRPRVRSLETIYAHIQEQQRFVTHLRTLAGEFAALDTRPMRFTPGESITFERVGPDPVPLELREWLTNETATLAFLLHEYAVARLGRD